MGSLPMILRVATGPAAGASVAAGAAGASVAAAAGAASVATGAGLPQAASIILARTNTDSKANKRLFIFLLLQNLLGEFDIPHVRVYKKTADNTFDVSLTSFMS
jgi:hypothetical protein